MAQALGHAGLVNARTKLIIEKPFGSDLDSIDIGDWPAPTDRLDQIDQLLADGMAIGGNPDSICRQVEQWAEAGLDQMIFILQAGRTTHDQVMRSIALLGKAVLPRFG